MNPDYIDPLTRYTALANMVAARFDAVETQLFAADQRLDGIQHVLARLMDKWTEIEALLKERRR